LPHNWPCRSWNQVTRRSRVSGRGCWMYTIKEYPHSRLSWITAFQRTLNNSYYVIRVAQKVDGIGSLMITETLLCCPVCLTLLDITRLHCHTLSNEYSNCKCYLQYLKWLLMALQVNWLKNKHAWASFLLQLSTGKHGLAPQDLAKWAKCSSKKALKSPRGSLSSTYNSSGSKIYEIY